MSENNSTDMDIKSLMDELADKDGMIRQKARESLVALGKTAVSSLIEALRNSASDQVRWEAAKALGAIGDTKSIPALVDALEDSDSDVTWLAAEALIKFEKAAWVPLLEKLVKSGPDFTVLHQGAHHILREQQADGFDDLLKTLVKTLDSGTDPESVMVTAHEILNRIKSES